MMNEKTTLPAEWEQQWGVMLTWPHAKTDWQPYLDEITETYIEMARAITDYEDLLIVTPEPEKVKALLAEECSLERVHFLECATNDTWARDHGFLTLNDGTMLDFCFNGWGEKFEAGLDNDINRQIYPFLQEQYAKQGITTNYQSHLDFVLEGGSIESDGKGTIFTTADCLLAPHRNNMSKDQLEKELLNRLHAQRVLWINSKPMPGDDTDGHIDTMVRICPDNTLLYNEDKTLEEQLKAFKTTEGMPYRLMALPLPDPIYAEEDGEKVMLPATYANFLIINGAVLLPTYGQPMNDMQAADILQEVFPDRDIILIDSRSIIKQHGSIHCCTMQFPQL